MSRGRTGFAFPNLLAAILSMVAICLSVPVTAQDRAEVLPSVGRLRAGVEKDAVEMSWIDADRGASGYAVFRSLVPVDTDSFPAAERIATVAVGTGSFTDRPPGGKGWYYAVLALDPLGKPFEVFTNMGTVTAVPLTTATGTPEATESPAPPAGGDKSAAPAGTASAAKERASPSTITPSAASVPSAAATSTSASEKPVSPPQSEAPAKAPATARVSSDGVAATLPEVIQGAQLPEVASVTWPDIPAAPYNRIAGRQAPLPSYRYLPSSGNAEAILATPGEAAISAEAMKATIALISASGNGKSVMPAIRLGTVGLGEEAIIPPPRDELDKAIFESLDRGDFGGIRDVIDTYLSAKGVDATQEVLARARYYRGVALAGLGRYQEALYEFIKAETRYPREAKAWTDYSLDVMAAAAR